MGEDEGKTLDMFQMALHLLELQSTADQPSIVEIEGLLSEGITFTHTSGSPSAAPSSPPYVGVTDVMAHLKASPLETPPGQLKRLKGKIRNIQPAKLLADGRTATNFEILVAGGTAIERLQDVLEWDDEGKLKSWVRVFEPRKSQRDWLSLISKGKQNALGLLVDGACRFAVLDGSEPRCYSGYAPVLEALHVLTMRMAGKVAQIGRTREVAEWSEWPKDLTSSGGNGGGKSGKSGKTANAPSTVQAVIIGTWRPVGSKWYGEEMLAMRETAEWTGSRITRLMWELIPLDHPHAAPVYARLQQKRKDLAREARRKAQAVLASAEDRANGNRPKWRDVEVVPVPKKGQLKTAADKIPAIDKLPPPPKTLPAPVKKK